MGKGLWLKRTAMLAFFLWLVTSLKNVNNRLVDHLEKCDFLNVKVLSERIAQGFNRQSLACWSSSQN